MLLDALRLNGHVNQPTNLAGITHTMRVCVRAGRIIGYENLRWHFEINENMTNKALALTQIQRQLISIFKIEYM